MNIDLNTTRDMLTNALGLLDKLHDQEVGPPDHGNPQSDAHRRARARDRELTRDLLFLRHTLSMAACLVDNEYFAVRGQDTGLDTFIEQGEQVTT